MLSGRKEKKERNQKMEEQKKSLLLRVRINSRNATYRVVECKQEYKDIIGKKGAMQSDKIMQIGKLMHPNDQGTYYKFLNDIYTYAVSDHVEMPEDIHIRGYNKRLKRYCMYNMVPEFSHPNSLHNYVYIDVISEYKERDISIAAKEVGETIFGVFDHSFLIDITTDSIEFCHNGYEFADNTFESNIYSEQMLSIRNKYIYPDDRKDFMDLFGYDAIKSAYETNKKEVLMELRLIGEDGEYHWFLFMLLLLNQITDTKKCILFIKNIDSSLEKKTKALVYGERSAILIKRLYTSEIVADLSSDCILEFRSRLGDYELQNWSYRYSDMISYIANEHIYVDDRERFKTFFNIRMLKELLKRSNTCEIYVRLIQYAERQEDIGIKLSVNLLQEDNDKCYIVILGEDVPYISAAKEVQKEIDHVQYTDLLLSNIDTLVRIERGSGAIQFIKNSDLIPQDMSHIQELYQYFSEHIYPDDRYIYMYLEKCIEEKLQNVSMMDYIRYTDDHQRYRWLMMQILSSERVEDQSYFYLALTDIHAVGPGETADIKSLDYETILRILRYSVICIDKATKTYNTFFYRDGKGLRRAGTYDSLVKNTISVIYEFDRDWVAQKLEFNHLVECLRSGSFEISFRSKERGELEWYTLHASLYQDANNKEYIYLIYHESSKQRAEAEKQLNEHLLNQSYFYKQVLEAKEDQICHLLKSTGAILFECNEELSCTYMSDTWTREFGFLFDKQDIFMYFLNEIELSETEHKDMMKLKEDIFQIQNCAITFHATNAEGTLCLYQLSTYSSFDDRNILQKVIGVINQEKE